MGDVVSMASSTSVTSSEPTIVTAARAVRLSINNTEHTAREIIIPPTIAALINIDGNCGSVSVVSADVTAGGAIGIATVSGDVNSVGDIGGMIKTVSGDARNRSAGSIPRLSPRGSSSGGVSISGSSVQIGGSSTAVVNGMRIESRGDDIYVNGTKIPREAGSDSSQVRLDGVGIDVSGPLTLVVHGDVQTVEGNVPVSVSGACTSLRTVSGDIHVGSVGADVKTVSGDVTGTGLSRSRFQTVSGDFH